MPLRTVAYCVKSRPGPVKVETESIRVVGDDYRGERDGLLSRGHLGSGGYRLIGDDLEPGEQRLPKYSYGAVHLRWGALLRISATRSSS